MGQGPQAVVTGPPENHPSLSVIGFRRRFTPSRELVEFPRAVR